MSTNQDDAPKRRSSTGRRRRARATVATAEKTSQVTTSTASEASVEAAEVEKIERHVQRRDERRAAKSQKSQRGMVAKVTENQRFSGVRKFYQETMSEIRKVIWPDRTQTRNLTVVVIALSVVMGTLLGGIDWTLLKVFELIG